jgi:hypothetical protein
MILGLSCTHEPDAPPGPPVSLDEVRAAFDTPTGTFEPSLQPVILDEIRRLDHLGTVLLKLFSIYPELKGLVAPSPSPGTSALTAVASPLTYAWLKFSCPGLDLGNPDRLFKNGQVKVESSDLVTSGGIRFTGYARLLFTKCAVESDLLDGTSHAWYDTASGTVTFLIDLADTLSGTPVARFDVDLQVAASGLTFLARIQDRTFVVGLGREGEALKATIKAANGSWTCVIQGESVGCEPG